MIRSALCFGLDKLAGQLRLGRNTLAQHTINGEIAERGRGGALDLDVGAVEKEEDGFESVAVYRSYVWGVSVSGSAQLMSPHTSLRDFGKGQACTSLQVNVVTIDKRAQCCKWFAGEEVGLPSLLGRMSVRVSHGRLRGVDSGGGTVSYIFEVIEQVCNSLTLRVLERILIVDFGAACTWMSQSA